MMMKQALILGCSHASGNELSGAGINDDFGLQNSYPALLAKLLGYEPANFAITGGSNDAMFRIGIDKYQQHDIVIACWTGADRGEVYDAGRWQPMSAGGMTITAEQYRQQWLLHQCDEAGRLNKIKNILALNAVCQVVNIDSFWPVQFEWPANVHWPVTDNFWDWCCGRNYQRTAFGHFEPAAHKDFADHVAGNVNL